MLIPLLLLFKHISLFSHIACILPQLPQTPLTILLLVSFLCTYLSLCQGRMICLGWRLITGLASLLESFFISRWAPLKPFMIRSVLIRDLPNCILLLADITNIHAAQPLTESSVFSTAKWQSWCNILAKVGRFSHFPSLQRALQDRFISFCLQQRVKKVHNSQEVKDPWGAGCGSAFKTTNPVVFKRQKWMQPTREAGQASGRLHNLVSAPISHESGPCAGLLVPPDSSTAQDIHSKGQENEACSSHRLCGLLAGCFLIFFMLIWKD